MAINMSLVDPLGVWEGDLAPVAPGRPRPTADSNAALSSLGMLLPGEGETSVALDIVPLNKIGYFNNSGLIRSQII